METSKGTTPAHAIRAACVAVLMQIAADSMHIAALVQRAIDSASDVDVVDTFCSAADVLARRVGWMAEMASADLGETGLIEGPDARDWLMPRGYVLQQTEG